MAVVHEMLYEEKSLNALTIKEFFDRLVSVSGCFASGNGSRIIAETIGSLQIGIDTAVPFALIVNEFILWSIENLKGMKGKIRISFIPGENNDYILKTTDDGPEEKPVADLSKTLTEALAKQINGRIIGPGEGGSGLSLCFSPEGACSDTEKFYSGETDRNSGTTASE
jgi:two-component sensor histidine kinase